MVLYQQELTSYQKFIIQSPEEMHIQYLVHILNLHIHSEIILQHKGQIEIQVNV